MLELKYKFKDESLLETALTQSGANAVHNNERLEFVGDRVLGLTIAELLYKTFPNETEGELARRHAMLVSTETLARVANEMDFAHRVHHGHMTAGRINHVLANAVEAVLGAIFLDGGFDAARSVIVDIWHDFVLADATAPKDPKTTLQELVQRQTNGELPVYEYLPPKGAAHKPVFNVRVTALGKTATGTGVSKKAASINAAEELLKILAIWFARG
ncbi:MAG: ribonuclease III [Alphaproteobacteria bacterium]|nr:ribonuclease III [Alphaproteobacteria bacterium]